MAAYAALVSLMNNVEQIQRHTRLPISLDKHQMESLLHKVSFLIDFLETYNTSLGDYKIFESRITDLAYEAEDIIETHVVDRIDFHSRCISAKKGNKLSPFGFLFPPKKVTARKNPNLSCLLSIENVLERMDFMIQEAMKIKDKRELEVDVESGSSSSTALSNSISIGKSSMVGFDDHLMQIREWLAGNSSSRQVISIVGMGGIGKTTLALNVYEEPLSVQTFDVRARVSISQEYSLRQIVLQLLSCVKVNRVTELERMNEDQLKEMLYKSLFGRRYLVVLDDMWTVEPWERVKMLFPDNVNSSRIIVTTRNSSVADYLGSYSLHMNLMNEEMSWNLFCEKVFGREGCSLELEEVGQKIVKNCKGLPLSIVVVGGLLSKSVQNKKYWESIARDTKSFISLEGDELCMRILYLSYHSLPVHLKPCFLYMGIIPEDGIIRVSLLIKLWVAEGFLKPNSSKELEIIGEEYLDNLISRNLILVHKYGSTGKVRSCMIHDLLRDVCLKEAQNEMFMYSQKTHSHDKAQCISTSQRRIVIHRSSSTKEHIHQVLKSIKSGWPGRSLICDVHKVLSLKNHRLLRVLKVCNDSNQQCEAEYSFDDTFRLVNSRFIAINLNYKRTFPSSLSLLWNLQILIVKGYGKLPVAPSEIWEMVELRHLKFDAHIYLPDPPLSQHMDTPVMKNLQTVKKIEGFTCSDEVVKKIPNIKKLGLSYERCSFTKEFTEYRLQNLGLLKKLESLSIIFWVQSPDVLSNITFPSSLKKLIIRGGIIRWDGMSVIGSLPHLEVLKLWCDDLGSEWVTVEGEFCCLKYLQLVMCDSLVHWRADSSHFPRLEHLELDYVKNLEEIPSGFGEILTLERIRLQYCCDSVVKSAKKLLVEREEFGNDGLRVYVDLGSRRDAEIESLASELIRVQFF